MTIPLEQLLAQSRGALPLDLPPATFSPRAIAPEGGVVGDVMTINTDGFPKFKAPAASAISGVPAGGTGMSVYVRGDVIYASDVTTLARLGIGAINTALMSTGTLPNWRRVTAA